MPEVAKYAGLYPVMRGDDKEAAKAGFDWIANADNTEATQIVCDEMLKIGEKYAKYGISRMLAPVLDNLLASKEKLKTKNSSASLEKQITIVKAAITKMTNFKAK